MSELDQVFQLFELWSQSATGFLKVNPDGSGSLRMQVSPRKSRAVLSWNSLSDAVDVLTEELTGDFVDTKSFCRKYRVRMVPAAVPV